MSYPRVNAPTDEWFTDPATKQSASQQSYGQPPPHQQPQQQYNNQQYTKQQYVPQPSYPQHVQAQPHQAYGAQPSMYPPSQGGGYDAYSQPAQQQQYMNTQQPQIYHPTITQQQQQQQQHYNPADNFFSSPMASVGMQFGQQLMHSDRVQSTISKVSSFNIKYYFAVDNTYVINKLRVLLLPFLHKQWSRKQYETAEYNATGGTPTNYRVPRDDINAPDLYIPLMALVTYILLISYSKGISGTFSPELIGMTASTTVVMLMLEVLTLKAALYLIATNYELTPSLLDLISYSSYKYVHWIIMLIVSLLTTNTVIFYVTVMVFSCFSAFFIMRTLGRSLVRHDVNSAYGDESAAAGTNRRNTFLLFTGLAQILITVVLVRKVV